VERVSGYRASDFLSDGRLFFDNVLEQREDLTLAFEGTDPSEAFREHQRNLDLLRERWWNLIDDDARAECRPYLVSATAIEEQDGGEEDAK
jgi:hypothetical protein